MAPRGAPGPASAESTADRAGRGKRDSRGGRGPSVSGPASPLRRTPAPPAAPRRAGQCQEDRPGPSPNRPHPPDSGKAVTWRASGGEDTTQKRKVHLPHPGSLFSLEGALRGQMKYGYENRSIEIKKYVNY
ncbi:atherin-like isoform X1 [Lagenorhynchus albirostris]|uniref:atherin-like isoform X1 n=1 Tax=Lagenorhynchus albirostris TaxID=27610 RepID=UPI0028F160C4|nr:atherin-like isoform X1 [Lagenorhynchus albirostris]